MRAALLLAFLLAVGAPAAAQQAGEGGWSLREYPAATPGAGRCVLSAEGAGGARLTLWLHEAGGHRSDLSLTLFLTDPQRAKLPLPDGPVQLAFRPAGQPATLLDGTIAPEGPYHAFTHRFADLEAQKAFLTRADQGRVTVFSPSAGVLASFPTQEASLALDRLLACSFPAPEALPND
ncbi:hypothetical protein [Vannielia sp.]|uniref:hypothetical protein n=1 Tax=Vannielia sp. TaxID=2813045 RepID=UPI0026290CDF|nr:hypothetical protein [Vannielia sp.]MDF1872616.1 hypothetical protein [Vannielia sp.]